MLSSPAAATCKLERWLGEVLSTNTNCLGTLGSVYLSTAADERAVNDFYLIKTSESKWTAGSLIGKAFKRCFKMVITLS